MPVLPPESMPTGEAAFFWLKRGQQAESGGPLFVPGVVKCGKSKGFCVKHCRTEPGMEQGEYCNGMYVLFIQVV
ncbi:MAG: hypothetical protein EA344_05665 [Alkalicoccus sp.]|nr:MAG: hypothetical protein EA344_05665 [Alkalicoccus sp.]